MSYMVTGSCFFKIESDNNNHIMSTHLHHRAVTYKLPTCIVGLINWMTVDKMIHRQEYYGEVGTRKTPKTIRLRGDDAK